MDRAAGLKRTGGFRAAEYVRGCVRKAGRTNVERIHPCGRGWEGRATVGMGGRADRSGWSGGCVAGHVAVVFGPGRR